MRTILTWWSLLVLVLGLRADHEAGHVLDEQERDALAVALVDEVRRLLGALGVDDAAKAGRAAARLADQAAAHLDLFGEKGDLLKGVARWVVERRA